MKKLLTGNEAAARGAYEAGVRFASAYPGTPSTEILETLSTTYQDTIDAQWACNEKVAMEAAIGASMGGVRALASMKHVGLNVAADPLFTYAYIGVDGGFVTISADEPGQHSSQNEQDNRYYAKMAKIPMVEPADSQETKDMMKLAFQISEEFDTPVLFRMTTRVCHSKGIVEFSDRTEMPFKIYEKNVAKRVTVPDIAKKMRLKVDARMEKLQEYTETTPLNKMEMHSTKIGVITSGMCYHYAKEVFGEDASYLKLGFTNPLPNKMMAAFAAKVEKLYIIEENDPYIEEAVKMLGISCIGKDVFPLAGEMTPDVLRKALYGEPLPNPQVDLSGIVNRPPAFCAGCPHRGVFFTLGKRKDIVVSGDIGCYTLGFAQPYNAMDFNICMGASISCGHGMQVAFNMNPDEKRRVVTILGDSTFFHTGVNSLINTAYNGGNTVNIILDNRITGMTGHQQNPGTGYNAKGEPAQMLDLEQLVKACGIQQVRTIDPNNLALVKETLEWAMALSEPSVIITKWPCALKKFSKEDLEEFGTDIFKGKCTVDEGICIGCKACVKSGCPALSFQTSKGKAVIDAAQCLGCGVCTQVCPVNAIS